MDDVESSTVQQTTTTVTTSVQTNIRFDSSYLRTLSGVLKCIQILASLLGFVCVQASSLRLTGRCEFYSWVSMAAFWFSGILLCLYLFHAVEKFWKIPWLRVECLWCGGAALLLLLAASLSLGAGEAATTAAAVFGYAAMAAYGVDGYVKLRGWRAGRLAQGARSVAVRRDPAAPAAPAPAAAPEREAY